MENNANSANSSFWQFSDNLRLQTNSLANLSLKDSIWSTNHASKRRNFDFRNDFVSGQQVPVPLKSSSDLNSTDPWKAEPWKLPNNEAFDVNYSGFGSGLNGGFNKGVYTSPSLGINNQSYEFNNSYVDAKGKAFLNRVVVNGKLSDFSVGKKNQDEHNSLLGGKSGIKKNKGNKESGKNSNNNNEHKVDNKNKFKTLPPEEALPRNETIGGYIFVCNNDTMAENLKRQLFGLPPRYRDSVRSITPGLPLFLYNYSTHQLHGIFEAASFGGTNIDPTAWEDKKNPGESRFPAQVRVVTRKICEPLEEDSFRPILHHYDGPKFRLELNVPEALSLLDSFAENSP